MIKILFLVIAVVVVIVRLVRRSKNKFSTEKFMRIAKEKPELFDEIIDTVDFPYKSVPNKQFEVEDLLEKLRTAVFSNYTILDTVSGKDAVLLSMKGQYTEYDTTARGRLDDVVKTRFDLIVIKNIETENKVSIYGSMYQTSAEKDVLTDLVAELIKIIQSDQKEMIHDLMGKMENALK